jgi:hypothetical protein
MSGRSHTIGGLIKDLGNAAGQDGHLIIDAIEAAKRFIHNEGSKRGLCAPYKGSPGPTPTNFECQLLLDGLRKWCVLVGSSSHALILQEFRDMIVCSSGTPITSGLLQPLTSFNEGAWRQVAGRADGALNDINVLALTQNPDLEQPWSGPEWDSLQRLPKALLKFMHDKQQARIEEIVRAVWHEDFENVSEGAIGQAQTKANKFLDKIRSSRRLTKPYGQSIIRWSS